MSQKTKGIIRSIIIQAGFITHTQRWKWVRNNHSIKEDDLNCMSEEAFNEAMDAGEMQQSHSCH
jgi:hypothetical protein